MSIGPTWRHSRLRSVCMLSPAAACMQRASACACKGKLNPGLTEMVQLQLQQLRSIATIVCKWRTAPMNSSIRSHYCLSGRTTEAIGRSYYLMRHVFKNAGQWEPACFSCCFHSFVLFGCLQDLFMMSGKRCSFRSGALARDARNKVLWIILVVIIPVCKFRLLSLFLFLFLFFVCFLFLCVPSRCVGKLVWISGWENLLEV